jgi:hypothetical protein
MPIVERHWEKLTDDQWQHLAEQYLLEIRLDIGKEFSDKERETTDYEINHKWGEIVTRLGFWSPPELLWKFILLSVSVAETDEELGDIAAGSIEYLLGRAGKEFIDLVEKEAKNNYKFARTLTGCWQYQMTDEVWGECKSYKHK